MVEGNLKSKELYERAKRLLPGGVNSPVRAFKPYPFFVNRAKGSRLYSADGKSYIDYCMAYGALLLGHAHEEIIRAVSEQLPKGTLYCTPIELEVELAELIHRIYPSMEMLRLVNTGTEATMHAIRAARGFTERKKIIMFEGCFHGSHDSVLVRAGSGAAVIPSSNGIPNEIVQNTIVLPYNNFNALDEVFSKKGHEIAAVIIEPIVVNSGLILPKKGYLEYLRKITHENGAVLIFDEVVTGFRVTLGGCQKYYEIKPDMTTLGKIIGGGFPLAAYGGKREIMENIAPLGKVYQAGTFSGNPISVVAGYTTVKLLKNSEQIYSELERNCKQIANALIDISRDYKIEAQVNSIASMFQIFFTSSPVVDYYSAKSSDIEKFHKYFLELLKNEVFIPPSQFETCFLSTAHSIEDCEITIEALNKALASMRGEK
ncbi:MAG: glutamate-1-semialdehyde 2,1-aminomutase [Candidatus Methanomethyliaceae archaeon]|nr:glutamate-1-semialdehyde 2,1-aminomutase [Candidatus Methanomethyliaceae archaeon]MDW7971358.1 glutamate-1-semialdehyde 2,1-aminomutase [Nitrososphaerota archaeon]